MFRQKQPTLGLDFDEREEDMDEEEEQEDTPEVVDADMLVLEHE